MDQKENIEIKEEKTNEEAGMILSDDELDQVSGGGYGDTSFIRVCSRCGKSYTGICSCDPLNPFRDQGPFL